jgi:hypothetical protein
VAVVLELEVEKRGGFENHRRGISTLTTFEAEHALGRGMGRATKIAK